MPCSNLCVKKSWYTKSMTITLAGTNTFSLGQELKQLVTDFVNEHGDMALEKLDGEEASYERIQEALTSLPFLADAKMVVLKKPSANKLFVQKYEDLLLEVPKSTSLIIIEPKPDKRSSYYKFIKKTTDYREFNELDNNGLSRWLVQTAKAKEGGIGQADASYLVERVGANQQALSNELEKLLLYNSTITRKTINELTEQAPQSTIFDLIEAAFSGNVKRTMAIYDEQRAQKVEPQQIIAMLTWQLHILALVKTAEKRSPQAIASEAKISPYVVQKTAIIARKLGAQKLKDDISGLLKLDLRLKRETINADDALTSYLLQLTS
jgi:DNA polymerase-3 subunit delta